MPYVESKTTIKGDGAKIYDIIKDMAAYPNFMHDLVSVEILERGENYTVSHWVSNVDGRKIALHTAFENSPPPWRQVLPFSFAVTL